MLALAAFHARSAHAATECEQNYTSSAGSGGGTTHQSFVGLYGSDTIETTAKLKLMAQKQGFQTIRDTDVSSDGITTTVVSQKASKAARGFPIVMIVSPDTDSAIIAFELPKGMTGPDVKGNLCSFFDAAGLKGETMNASRLKADQNSSLATPLLSVLNGGLAIDKAVKMAVDSGRQTRGANSERGAAPEVADRRKVVRPKGTFNPADVHSSMLSRGSSTINGLTCARVMVVGGAQFQEAPNQTIMLYPYNPYLKEAIDLIDANRAKGNKVRVEVDQRAFAIRLDGTTNGRGEFQFSGIKPGRYIIMTPFEGSAVSYINTPQSSYDGSTNTLYTWTDREQVNTSSSDILQAEVTVNQEGQVVDGVVVKPRGNGRFIPVLDGVCNWHHKK